MYSVIDLACHDATQLFVSLEQKTGQRQDPCVWDVFAAMKLRQECLPCGGDGYLEKKLYKKQGN